VLEMVIGRCPWLKADAYYRCWLLVVSVCLGVDEVFRSEVQRRRSVVRNLKSQAKLHQGPAAFGKPSRDPLHPKAGDMTTFPIVSR